MLWTPTFCNYIFVVSIVNTGECQGKRYKYKHWCVCGDNTNNTDAHKLKEICSFFFYNTQMLHWIIGRKKQYSENQRNPPNKHFYWLLMSPICCSGWVSLSENTHSYCDRQNSQSAGIYASIAAVNDWPESRRSTWHTPVRLLLSCRLCRRLSGAAAAAENCEDKPGGPCDQQTFVVSICTVYAWTS